MMQRTCQKCGDTKDSELFVTSSDCRNGRRNTCKVCQAANARAWQRSNPKRCRATRHKYRDRAKVKAHAWYQKNKERLKVKRLAVIRGVVT